MAIITQTVHLTTKTNAVPQIVRAVQNDSGRDIKMILDDLIVTSGMTGELTFKRSDGTFYGVTATPNTSDHSFTAQMDQALTQPGKTLAQLKVTDTDVVSTFSFVIYVEADQSGTVTPQEGIDLVSAVQAAEDAADRAESAAESAEEQAELVDAPKIWNAITYDAKALGKSLGFYPIPQTGKGRIPCNKEVGQTVNLSDIRSSTEPDAGYWIIPCSEGDVLTVNVNGAGTTYRAFAFLNASDEVLYITAKQTTTLENQVFTAPENTAKALIQSIYNDDQYIGEYSDIDQRINDVDADIKETKTSVVNRVVITNGTTVPYYFTVGKTYEITNNCDVTISFRTRLSPSSSNVESTSVSSGKTKDFTCGSAADGISIYASGATVFEVIVQQKDSLEYQIGTVDAKIESVNTEVGNVEKSLKNAINVTSSGTKDYNFTSGKSYFIKNDSTGQISFRTVASGEIVEQFNVSSGKTKVFDCTVNASGVNIYIASGTIDVHVEEIGTYDYRITDNAKRIDELDDNVIPSYFQTMMNTKIPQIRQNMNAVGRNGDTFVFITDIHWDRNAKNSLKLISYIISKTNINKVICGGDIISQGEPNAMMDDMNTVIKGMEFPFHNDLLVAFGNHDSNILSTVEDSYFDLNTCYALMEKEAESYITMMTDYDLSFYYDCNANHTRYIVLDMGEDSGSENRVFTAYQELADTLLDTPEDWNIIVIAHIVTYGRFTYISGMMDAYNDKTTYTNPNAGTFDFTTAEGTIICAFGGHTHVDSDFTTTGGIPVIVTGTDSDRVGDEPVYPYVAGTDQEQCFDVVTIDYVNKTIKCVRIGRGVDRTISYS